MLNRLPLLQTIPPSDRCPSNHSWTMNNVVWNELLKADDGSGPSRLSSELTKKHLRIDRTRLCLKPNQEFWVNISNPTPWLKLYFEDKKRETHKEGKHLSGFTQIINSLVMCWSHSHSSQSLTAQWLLTFRKINLSCPGNFHWPKKD